MFSFFGKRRSSPIENEIPPIPGPKTDDGFVVIDSSPRGGIYPSVSGSPAPLAPYPQRPAPPAPVPKMNSTDQSFNYLQGVPFSLCKELQMANNKDAFTTEVSNLLAFLTSKVNMSGYEYDFSVEKSVLKEY